MTETAIVSRHGRPLTMYHGTTSKFDAFDERHWGDDRGFFFTPRLAYARQYARGEDGRVITAHLSMRRPYRCTEMDWGWGKGLSLEEARQEGYDGYIVAPYSLGTMFVVWDPRAIHILSHDLDVQPHRLAA